MFATSLQHTTQGGGNVAIQHVQTSTDWRNDKKHDNKHLMTRGNDDFQHFLIVGTKSILVGPCQIPLVYFEATGRTLLYISQR